MATAKYVRCRVSPGFFGTELYVIVGDSSAFVDRHNVKLEAPPEEGKQVDGSVLAYVVAEEQERALVELPGQAVVGGLRTWIPKQMLSPA